MAARQKTSNLKLTIKSLDNKFHDRREVLLHAAFQLLVDYIEEEEPGKTLDWSWDKEHRRAWKEITSLYDWWKKDRPKRKYFTDCYKFPKTHFEPVENGTSAKWVFDDPDEEKKFHRLALKDNRLDDKWDAEDQHNLHRLVSIREYLWT